VKMRYPSKDMTAIEIPGVLAGISTLELLTSTAGNHHVNLLDSLKFFLKIN
jgi:hypothetical protein